MPAKFSMFKLACSSAAALLVLAVTVPLAADARPGRGLSQGSRGLKTYTPPPSTRTAPGATQPMQRSATPAPGQAQPGQAQPGQPGQAQTAAARAQPAAAAASQSRFGTGFMAGLLGAGLFGALLGAGMFGNLGSLTAILGLVLQAALIAGLAYLVIGYFRNRQQTAAVGPRQAMARAANEPAQPPRGLAGGGIRIGSAAPDTATPMAIEAADFASFERLLSVIQLAYGRGDSDALKSAATPEMVGYLQEELDENARKGLRNVLGEPKLLSGDLSEAWSENSAEYATVAMRYAITDAMVELGSGRLVSGSKTEPSEVTEVWTFTRRPGSGPASWRLSAIQQV